VGGQKTAQLFGSSELSANSSNSYIAQLGFVFGAR
jgi:hypothetical protein